jgi:hypothetical protein
MKKLVNDPQNVVPADAPVERRVRVAGLPGRERRQSISFRVRYVYSTDAVLARCFKSAPAA